MSSKQSLSQTARRAWRIVGLVLAAALVLATLPALSLPRPAFGAGGPPGAPTAAVEQNRQDIGASAAGWPALKKLTDDGGAAGDLFGWSVSINGDIIVVGAREDDSGKGAAYVFGRDQGGTDNWGLVKKLTASDAAPLDYFGAEVSADGDTIVVGAYRKEYGTGAAYVFYRNQGGPDSWGQVKKLTTSTPIDWCDFGMSVSISGNTIVVGASGEEAEIGAAYVFYRDQGGTDHWGQVARLIAADRAEYEQFGGSVAVYGDTVVVGSMRNDSSKGAAYVFYRDQGGADNWGQFKKLTAGDAAYGDGFGRSVSINDTTIAVGAHWKDTYTGAAYVFYRDQGGTDNWGQVAKLTAANGAAGDFFGIAISVDGDTVVVGVSGRDYWTGAACVFSRNQGGANQWGQVTRLKAGDAAEDDAFGSGVSVHGDTIVAGAYGDKSEQGAAYVYVFPYALRVNAAGPKYVDKGGNLWVADRAWREGATTWGYVGGIARIVSASIANTLDDKLYQSERLFTGAARPGYKFVVPNGHYMLTFKYAETYYWNAPGRRVFTVMAENKICFANYDPLAAAGGVRYRAAPDKVCYVNVNDGILDLSFISVAGQAKADAIYIQQIYQ